MLFSLFSLNSLHALFSLLLGIENDTYGAKILFLRVSKVLPLFFLRHPFISLNCRYLPLLAFIKAEKQKFSVLRFPFSVFC